MPLAAIALGSNVPGQGGTREANLEGAVQALMTLGQVMLRSRWYDTAPEGFAEQPRFLNGAVVLETPLSPRELLNSLLRIELDFGRDRSHGIAKGPRTLDLDLLLYDELQMHETELTLPHPAMHERRFVLEPLAEIAPHWVHPVLGKSVKAMLSGVS